MTPAFVCSVGGSNLGNGIGSRLLELVVTDNDGSESDSVSIRVDDRNGEVAIPPRGGIMAVALGYKETGVMPMGLYTVDEVTCDGYPMSLTVTGRSADLKQKFKSQRAQGYENKTLGDVLTEVAGRNNLAPFISGSINAIQYKYLAQDESDLAFIQRLANKHDAVVNAKNGKLIFAKKGETDFGVVAVTVPGQLLSYEVTFADRAAHEKSMASWWDFDEAKRTREEASGTEGGFYEMHSLWPDGQAEAQEVAKSKASALGRDEKTGRFEVVGNPLIRAEMHLVVGGVRPGVDGLYRIKTATHRLTNQGYQTEMSVELPAMGGGGG
jgi:phage protein D